MADLTSIRPSSRTGKPALSSKERPLALPARMLNEYVYCPRLFYYEFVQGVFVENADTLRGKAVHRRVDAGKGALPPAAKKVPEGEEKKAVEGDAEVIHARSVWLGSDRLGVSAKIDLVEIEGGGEGTTARRVCPVDYKAGSPREGEERAEIWDTDKMQLGLQALILRDNGYACEEGIIFYRGTRQRVRLALTGELENWILGKIEAAREATTGPIPPPLLDSPKCPRCSLVGICLPDETRLLSHPPERPEEEEEEREVQQTVFPFDSVYNDPASNRPGSPWVEILDRYDKFKAEELVLPRPRPTRRLIAARDDKRPLYLNSYGLYVGRKSEVLQVKEKGKVVAEIRINDLHHVALFGSVQISTPAVQTLCRKDIPVTYFSMGGWFYGMTRGHSLKNVFTRIEQFRQADRLESCLFFARSFVYGKIRNQRTMLRRNHLEPPLHALRKLKFASSAVLGAGSLEELLGLEGAAALTYFQNFSGMIKVGREPGETRKKDNPDQLAFNFDFKGRNRRPPRDAVNALLSLGYSMLARDCTIAAYAVGFDPYIGFFHRPRFGRPALALDVMEEFRPLIADSVVLNLLNNRIITEKDFIRAGDAVNLTPGGRKSFFLAYEKRLNTTINHPVFDYKVSYRRAMELQFRLLAKTLAGEIESYFPFMTR